MLGGQIVMIIPTLIGAAMEVKMRFVLIVPAGSLLSAKAAGQAKQPTSTGAERVNKELILSSQK